jgi:N utilization substance protein A
MQTPRTEFAQALKAVATERGLDADVILETIRQAIIAAYRRDARERGEDTENFDFDVALNPINGEAKIFSWPVTVSEDGTRTPTGDEKKDVTPPGFGRIAAQTAKQVIHQKIREAEKGAIMDEFSLKVGTLISGMILRFDGSDVKVDIGRTEAIMPADERIPNEHLTANQRLTFLLKDIKEGAKGKEIILSRADPVFVEKLFAREVPEISSGSVVIKLIAREAGVRTKIAVASEQSGVDPVGSCVGQRGVRVQAVTNELGGERIDVIPYCEDLKELIAGALSPAENLVVALDKDQKIATVTAPEDQLSQAIGKEGQNVRLAAKLTGVRIEVAGAKVDQVERIVRKEVKQLEKPDTELEKAEKKEMVVEDTKKAVIKKPAKKKAIKPAAKPAGK